MYKTVDKPVSMNRLDVCVPLPNMVVTAPYVFLYLLASLLRVSVNSFLTESQGSHFEPRRWTARTQQLLEIWDVDRTVDWQFPSFCITTSFLGLLFFLQFFRLPEPGRTNQRYKGNWSNVFYFIITQYISWFSIMPQYVFLKITWKYNFRLSISSYFNTEFP